MNSSGYGLSMIQMPRKCIFSHNFLWHLMSRIVQSHKQHLYANRTSDTPTLLLLFALFRCAPLNIVYWHFQRENTLLGNVWHVEEHGPTSRLWKQVSVQISLQETYTNEHAFKWRRKGESVVCKRTCLYNVVTVGEYLIESYYFLKEKLKCLGSLMQ